ncbi:MAG: hypothetical protein Q4D04_11315 [Clostridia bacterium]|nr:hypothetical protein [Clostridia bacterium]
MNTVMIISKPARTGRIDALIDEYAKGARASGNNVAKFLYRHLASRTTPGRPFAKHIRRYPDVVADDAAFAKALEWAQAVVFAVSICDIDVSSSLASFGNCLYGVNLAGMKRIKRVGMVIDAPDAQSWIASGCIKHYSQFAARHRWTDMGIATWSVYESASSAAKSGFLSAYGLANAIGRPVYSPDITDGFESARRFVTA